MFPIGTVPFRFIQSGGAALVPTGWPERMRLTKWNGTIITSINYTCVYLLFLISMAVSDLSRNNNEKCGGESENRTKKTTPNILFCSLVYVHGDEMPAFF